MKRRWKKTGPTAWILVALLMGAAAGTALHYVPSGYVRDQILVDGIFYVIGQGFLRLMQLLVVPLVLASLVCGSASIGDTKTLGKVGGKTVGFYLATTALAVATALALGWLLRPGSGLNLEAAKTAQEQVTERESVADTLLNLIPKNPAASLAEGNILQIIVFAVLLGIVLARLGEKAETVACFFFQLHEMMMEMTGLVMKAAPLGVFCLVGRTFAGIGAAGMLPMGNYMICVLLGLAIHCFAAYPALLSVFTGLNPFRFIRKYYPVMSLAFSTASSTAAIPLAIETLEERIGVSREISSFTIPLGATINMDGTAIMQGVAVCFAAQAYGIPLAPSDYLTVVATATLASVGTAGVPGVGLITLSMVFQAVHLPVEAIGMIMGIDRVLDMARTAVNVTGDAMCTTIVAWGNGSVNREVFSSRE